MNLDEIYKAVDNIDPDRIMEIMKKLISVDTTVPPGSTYRDYIDIISPYFRDLGFNLEEIVVPEELVKQIPYNLEGPRINLVASKNFGVDEDITFYGHMDVVPVPDEGSSWRFPPFAATMTKNGKIFGRGTADMKGAMVCLILALQVIEKLNLKPKYNITVLNCTDEEIGVWPGVRYLAEQGFIKGTVFCMEGLVNPFIVIGTAGTLDVKVESIGKSCHSGMNFLGINALEETIPILNELMDLKKQVEARENKKIPGLPQFGTGIKRNMTPMFNLDIIHSGIKSNIVPDLCTLTINRRVIPGENIEDVKNEIAEAINRGKSKSRLLDVKTTYIYDYPPMTVDPDNPAILRMIRVIMEVQNIAKEEVKIFGASGSTDMGFVSEILDKKDIIFYGVGTLGSNLHGVNEFIRLKDVLLYLKELIVFLCGDF